MTAVGRRPRPTGRRRAFGTSWWGQAWIEALEERARLDPNRLPRGRTYARAGRVGPLEVAPGVIRAAVHGSRRQPYQVNVRVRVLRDAEWDRLLDAVAARAGHTAALLDGELPPEVVADAGSVGVELLPGPGELGPRCSCPDWADPCKHAAAVVYLMADVLDADPFALLTLRGRAREEVMGALRLRRRGSADRRLSAGLAPIARLVDSGVAARDAYAQRGTATSLPRIPLPPSHPGDPVPLAVDPEPGSRVRRSDLSELVADATRRAWEICVGQGDGGLHLDPSLDLARRAAEAHDRRGPGAVGSLAAAAGMRAAELGRLSAAWKLGGADAVGVLRDSCTPDGESLDEARSACGRMGPVQVRANRVTFADGGGQLRLGRAGYWYRFERVGARWELMSGPAADPADLIASPWDGSR
ncbi:MAG TPA: SWIM zinc finger family protein [Acidimicrobiales bacterium]|nr:SWIM zinc finger family protein [Acidimicrobiales bacterium]